MERTIIPPARAGGGSKLRGRRFGLLAARIVPSEALAFFGAGQTRGVRARARALVVQWFAEGGIGNETPWNADYAHPSEG